MTSPNPTITPPGPAAPERKKSALRRHPWRTFFGTVAVLVIAGSVGSAASGGGSSPAPASKPAASAPAAPAPAAPAPAPPPAPSSASAKPAKPAPHYTVSQQQAIGSAQDYLSFQAFSRKGLIQQLSSKYGEGFSRADATFAVNHIRVDWNKEAVQSAKDYLSTQHFSRAGLIEQLSSSFGDGFTKAQAIYAVNHVGL
jgi:hypothetical protein